MFEKLIRNLFKKRHSETYILKTKHFRMLVHVTLVSGTGHPLKDDPVYVDTASKISESEFMYIFSWRPF